MYMCFLNACVECTTAVNVENRPLYRIISTTPILPHTLHNNAVTNNTTQVVMTPKHATNGTIGTTWLEFMGRNQSGFGTTLCIPLFVWYLLCKCFEIRTV